MHVLFWPKGFEIKKQSEEAVHVRGRGCSSNSAPSQGLFPLHIPGVKGIHPLSGSKPQAERAAGFIPMSSLDRIISNEYIVFCCSWMDQRGLMCKTTKEKKGLEQAGSPGGKGALKQCRGGTSPCITCTKDLASEVLFEGAQKCRIFGLSRNLRKSNWLGLTLR